ncbi:heme-binding protein [Haloarculaceae archaeon H-GB2-1]|nr:heme-binding protein [Haloarculaceae archaeon H-GB1-1]MEA5389071.1 heme-binding protein [Haloarculaceae archaeon H-GB11]MEA5407132.1 heme-binding protein [Haloarculaceae archaeon H-GB2-1]
MERRTPPHTEEGWYALHDFRTIDWDAWNDAPQRVRERALDDGIDYLRTHVALADAEEGATAVFSILGHKADLLVMHLRPTTSHLDTAERRFENTELARFTEQTTSYVSVTEASGYTEKAREYFEGDGDENSGIANYIQTRLKPTPPDAEHVCFYPMSKRRDPEQNWYDLPFDERTEHMKAHGDIGRDYAGRVVQMISGSVGFDDYEWGVTLYGDDPTDIKELLYEMRFDPSTSQYAEFGPFYFGRRIEPTDLRPLLAGEPVGHGADSGGSLDETPVHPDDAADDVDAHPHASGHGTETAAHSHGDGGSHGGAHPGSAAEGDHPHGDDEPEEVDDIEQRLATFGVEAGTDYDDGDYGLVCYSSADAQDLADEVDGLRENFEHYDTHVLTTVRAQDGQAAVVSVWANERAADTASGFLADLPGVGEIARGPLGDSEAAPSGTDEDDDIRGELEDLDIYAGKPHGEDVYAMVLYSEADPEELSTEVDDLRDGFDRYDTHVKTATYVGRGGGRSAVVSLWETRSAADKAGDFLSELPGIVARAGEESGFGTMGMFYTVQPDRREDFVGTFEEVGEMLADMDGHLDTELLVNGDDENDMFIASQWASKDDAMTFFRSDAFSETVAFGREVLADRPRHVFLA